METVGIIDFSRRDIDKPVKERTVRRDAKQIRA